MLKGHLPRVICHKVYEYSEINLYGMSCFKTKNKEPRFSRTELLLNVPGASFELALKTFSKSIPLNRYHQNCRNCYGFRTGGEKEARQGGSVVGGSVVGGSVGGGSVVLLNHRGPVVSIVPHVGLRAHEAPNTQFPKRQSKTIRVIDIHLSRSLVHAF